MQINRKEFMLLPLPMMTTLNKLKSVIKPYLQDFKSGQKLMARETGPNCLNFVPKTINLSQTTSSLTLNQLWVFVGKETRRFVSLQALEQI